MLRQQSINFTTHDDEFVQYLVANFESETINPVQLITMKNQRYETFDGLKIGTFWFCDEFFSLVFGCKSTNYNWCYASIFNADRILSSLIK